MEALLDEVESLEAILMEDVNITRNAETGIPELIETVVLPIVGEEIDRQYVCITLEVMPTVGYPDVKPNYQLRNPRGLDDNSISAIKSAIEQKLDEAIGAPVVFDLIDIIRERLTDSNLPSGQCVVCLYGFQEGDSFAKTECYHHLHSYCLARHLNASRKNYDEEQDKLPAWQRITSKPFQAFCPVCRESICNHIGTLENAEPPSELKNAPEFELTSDLKGLQARMADLFMHQKERGGIIDLNAEESNVISIDAEGTRQEQATKVTGNANNTYGLKAQNEKQITASSAMSNNQRNPKGKEAKQRNAAVKDTSADTSDDEKDDERRGRRGGKNHRRNGYHHHRHHYPNKNRNGNGGSASSANADHVNSACSSSTR